MRAVETLNGVDLGGRKILVREDREDKDVKNYNRCAAPAAVANILLSILPDRRSTAPAWVEVSSV